ncbi:MAG: hypothetical protein U5L45_11260 [Saprospiraceae bacterium]|nr:hypothetical protein [Saprospiraceae bacterium]
MKPTKIKRCLPPPHLGPKNPLSRAKRAKVPFNAYFEFMYGFKFVVKEDLDSKSLGGFKTLQELYG